MTLTAGSLLAMWLGEQLTGPDEDEEPLNPQTGQPVFLAAPAMPIAPAAVRESELRR